MSIYAVANLKGGIGKTATAQALGAGLALNGKRVLLIDLDNQLDLTIATGKAIPAPSVTAYEVIIGQADITKAIIPIKDNLDILPASDRLSILERTLTDTGKEFKLKEALAPILGSYNAVVIDCPPSLDIRTLNALTVANYLVLPAKGDLFSLQATNQTLEAVATIRRYTNPEIKVAGILLTQFNPRTVLHPYYRELLGSTQGIKIFASTIRNSVAIAEAQANMQDIFSYAPKSKVAEDYRIFIKELLA